MFTGIIEELGKVQSVENRGDNARIVIEARLVVQGTNHGDSIAVNGVCLTALDITSDSFAADVSMETLARSTLGNLKPGTPVNLERSVTPATRLGGHIVQGHVDARGQLLAIEEETWTGDSVQFRVRALGQSANGKIDIFDDHVLLEVTLPWLLAKFAEKLVPAIRKEGGLMLEKK